MVIVQACSVRQLGFTHIVTSMGIQTLMWHIYEGNLCLPVLEWPPTLLYRDIFLVEIKAIFSLAFPAASNQGWIYLVEIRAVNKKYLGV